VVGGSRALEFGDEFGREPMDRGQLVPFDNTHLEPFGYALTRAHARYDGGRIRKFVYRSSAKNELVARRGVCT
jgi:hypothetical protein